jgi:hypothetical protein
MRNPRKTKSKFLKLFFLFLFLFVEDAERKNSTSWLDTRMRTPHRHNWLVHRSIGLIHQSIILTWPTESHHSPSRNMITVKYLRPKVGAHVSSTALATKSYSLIQARTNLRRLGEIERSIFHGLELPRWDQDGVGGDVLRCVQLKVVFRSRSTGDICVQIPYEVVKKKKNQCRII